MKMPRPVSQGTEPGRDNHLKHQEAIMQQPSGRHRRPRRTLAGQAWAIAAAMLAAALAFVFVPRTFKRQPAAITPAPERRALPTAALPQHAIRDPDGFPTAQMWSAATEAASTRWGGSYRLGDPDSVLEDVHPDEVAGALVRPYMPPPPPVGQLVPRARLPEGDLLEAEPTSPPDDLGDLTAAIRVYLETVGRAGGRS
jgi:hypothetical protein